MNTTHSWAAGGVVACNGRVLVLRSARYSDLRLPKGHIEADESPQSAALREVAEESGYADLEVIADLGEQTVEFDVGDQHTVRNEHYYLMQLRSTHQVPRDLSDLKFTPEWMDWDQAIEKLEFDEERRWLVKARVLLDG
jgi:8-oxo-dGTP pyrophosphatase MutT (NUDIX family)